jgi:enoyl-CoA hydratase
MSDAPAGSDGSVRYTRHGTTAVITFDRPSARNALTEPMYAQLEACMDGVHDDDEVRVLVLRGAGGSFVSGTDISHFTSFTSGDDGVLYERRMDDIVARLENVPIPTIAVVEGHAAGAGLLLATACDLRICTPDARFGAPIARTVGNCLSVANTARLLAHLGVARTKTLLLTAAYMDADEAKDAGFVIDVVATHDLDARVGGLCDHLAAHAPITMAVAKEMVRRIVAAGMPDGDDLIRQVYGSEDFREGVAAFLAKRRPGWKGQ